MDRAQVFSHTDGCYSGEPASCTFACPFRLDLRSFLKKAAKGRWDAAYKELRAAVLFPELIAALCPHPCEEFCQVSTVCGGDPIAVRELERACLRFAKKKRGTAYTMPPQSETIAVVGAGPAGLASALVLAQKRFDVTVFDKNAGWGGSLRGHDDFSVFEQDFADFASTDAKFLFGTEVHSLGELDGFDAVILATGKSGGDFGLTGSFDSELCATDNPRVFLCGELAGFDLMEGMSAAKRAARSAEAFVKSGSPDFAREDWNRENRRRYVPHPDVSPLPQIIPKERFYNEDEARSEASRCMQCDCTACMDGCELLTRYNKKPPRIANDVFMDGQSRNSVSSASITRQTWSCNLCGNCGQTCHVETDVRGLFHLSRIDRVSSGSYPPAIHAHWLREMDFAATEGAFMIPGISDSYAFFPGCRLGASSPAFVTKPYTLIRERLGAGLLQNCCGAPAYWAGDGEAINYQLSILRNAWTELGKPTLITACASCERMLSELLPEIPLVSLYTILETLQSEEGTNMQSRAVFESAAVFDPCAAAGHPEAKFSVRRLAESSGTALTDFDSNGKCCGWGGHMQLANPALYEEITQNRTEATDAPYIVYCANCREVFLARGKDCAHILELVFDIEAPPVPTLEGKRQNSLELKARLLKQYLDEDYTPPVSPWDDLELDIPDELQQKMDKQLITSGDVRETIWRGEQNGEGFSDGENTLCSRVDEALTYWVRYRRDGSLCKVSEVYAHRMRM